MRIATLLLALALAVGAALPAPAQVQAVDLQLVGQQPNPIPWSQSRVLLRPTIGPPVWGTLSQAPGSVSLQIPGRPPISLRDPHQLPTVIAVDGSRFLQFGQVGHLVRHEVTRRLATDLYWFSSTGEPVASVRNQLSAQADVSMSADGVVLVIERQDRGADLLKLFSVDGNQLWSANVPPHRWAREVAVAAAGHRAVLVSTDRVDVLANHRIALLGPDGSSIASRDGLGVIQRIILVGRHVFVQAQYAHGVVDVDSGDLVWWREDQIRVVAPTAVRASPDSELLFLVVADWRGRLEPAYRWVLRVIRAADGEPVGSLPLQQPYQAPVAAEIERVTDSQVVVAAESDLVTFAWMARQ